MSIVIVLIIIGDIQSNRVPEVCLVFRPQGLVWDSQTQLRQRQFNEGRTLGTLHTLNIATVAFNIEFDGDGCVCVSTSMRFLECPAQKSCNVCVCLWTVEWVCVTI